MNTQTDETQVDSSTTEVREEETSTEEQEQEESSSSTEKESKTVPYERFKEVNDTVKDLKAKLAERESGETDNGTQLSQKDLLTLAKADVHEDDLDDVLEFAQFKKISIAEALKSSTVKNILSEKAEARETAKATSIKGGRPSAHKPSDAQILKEAQSGNIPKPGTPEAEALFRARHGLSEDTKV